MDPTRPGENLAALTAELAAFDRLDPVIHTRGRLGIVSVLAAHGPLTFTLLRDALRLTDGNLAAHLRALETAGYIAQSKVTGPGKVLTEIALSGPGREAFDRYVDALESLIGRSRPSAPVAPPPPRAVAVADDSGGPGSLTTELL